MICATLNCSIWTKIEFVSDIWIFDTKFNQIRFTANGIPHVLYRHKLMNEYTIEQLISGT